MHTIWNIQLNLFSLAILVIIYTNIRRRKEGPHPDQQLFYWLLAMVAVLLAADLVYLFVNGRAGRVLYYVNLISASISFFAQPVLCFLWCLYTRYQLTGDIEKAAKPLVLLLLPFVFNTVFVLINFWTPIYFFIDESNVYRRGALFYLAFVLAFFQYLYAMGYTIAKRQHCEPRVFLSLLLFPLPTFLCGVLQTVGAYMLIWPGATLSLLLIYLNIQKNELYTDYLTGLYNRRFLDLRLAAALKSGAKPGKLGVLMLDIDQFKSINDEHGHVVGDQALIEAAEVVKMTVGRRGFTARYGGDEYVVVVRCSKLRELEEISREIDENACRYYIKSDKPYCVRMSFGYEIFDCGGKTTAQEVFDRIDRQMYRQKQEDFYEVSEKEKPRNSTL